MLKLKIGSFWDTSANKIISLRISIKTGSILNEDVTGT